MRACRAVFVVLAVAVVSMLGAGSASAGGPTSVLLVEPGSGESASLYYSDKDYELLGAVLGASGERPVEADTSASGHDVGPSVNVTWLIHDVQVWRVDQVYPAAPGGPWISTRQVLGDAGSVWDSPVVWHRATDVGLLESLLRRLGVMPGEGAAPVAVEPPVTAELPGAAEAPLDAETPARSAPAAQDDPSAPGWLWGFGGLVLGAGLAAAALRAARPGVRPVSPTGDLPSTPDAVDDWAPHDELASPGPHRG
jgi:hypothetical protein